tara:strand:- start:4506 stop:5762 length:1257 start_codon:yes stop_codon:yes gene_type:complete
MAEKYKKEEVVRIAKIKEEAVVEREVKSKTIETTKEATEALKVVDGVRPANLAQNVYVDGGVDTSSQQGLTDLGIYLPIETTSQEEIQKILETIEVAPATQVVNFNLNYDVELIPVPDMNKIYSLTTIESNVWDKPTWEVNENTDQFEEVHVLSNFITQSNYRFNVSVAGVAKTEFELVIYDSTNKKWYNWTGFSETQVDGDNASIYTAASGFNNGFSAFSGVIPDNGRTIVTIDIPSVSIETEYKIGFNSNAKDIWGKTKLNKNIPQWQNGWNIGETADFTPLYRLTQLAQSSTTVKLEPTDLDMNPTGDLVISHMPGAKLDSSTKTNGKHNVNFTVSPRKKIQLRDSILNGILTESNLELGVLAENLETKVVDVDLIASVNSETNVGTVSGTITLGSSSLRPSTILVNTRSLFTTN